MNRIESYSLDEIKNLIYHDENTVTFTYKSISGTFKIKGKVLKVDKKLKKTCSYY